MGPRILKEDERNLEKAVDLLFVQLYSVRDFIKLTYSVNDTRKFEKTNLKNGGMVKMCWQNY